METWDWSAAATAGTADAAPAVPTDTAAEKPRGRQLRPALECSRCYVLPAEHRQDVVRAPETPLENHLTYEGNVPGCDS